MKRDLLRAASTMLTPEEQRMLLHMGTVADEEGPVVAFDMDIRTGMCAALSDLGGAVNALLYLLDECRVPDNLSGETRMAYMGIMERIGSAAVQATEMVERSHAFDQDTLLALAPEGSAVRQ